MYPSWRFISDTELRIKSTRRNALKNRLQARRVTFRQDIFTKAKCQGTLTVGSFGRGDKGKLTEKENRREKEKS